MVTFDSSNKVIEQYKLSTLISKCLEIDSGNSQTISNGTITVRVSQVRNDSYMWEEKDYGN